MARASAAAVNKMTPEEREHKESQLRTLKSDMFTPVKDVADYKEIKYIAKFIVACKTAGFFEQIGFEEPFDFEAWESERQSMREEINRIQKELDDDDEEKA